MCLKFCRNTKIALHDKNILLRRPQLNDIKSLLEFINSLVKERVQISINRKLTFKEEKEWVKNQLNEIKQNKLHYFVATHKKEIIGGIELRKGKWSQSHVAEIGISIKKQYRGIGLGTAMMKHIIKIARKDPEIKVLYIRSFVTNKPAIGLYKKFGFKKIARLSKRHFYKSKYVDEFILDYPLNRI